MFEAEGVEAGVVADDRMMPEVLRPVQTHSCNVAVIGRDGVIPNLDDTDALICMAPEMKIGVRTADCVPVVVYAPDIQAVAAIHAGWRGSLEGIAGKTMERLKELGADMAKAEAAFGPSICGGCYEVSQDLAERFKEEGYSDSIVAVRHIDLQAVNTKQLLSAGIPPDRIHTKRFCTYETEWLPSWRRNPADIRLLTWIREGHSTRGMKSE